MNFDSERNFESLQALKPFLRVSYCELLKLDLDGRNEEAQHAEQR